MEKQFDNPIVEHFYYFFWWFSGTRKEYILPYPTEYERYYHIGATVFLTWFMATLGGIYLFSFVFIENDDHESISVLAGLIWGIIILNLDRYMIVTITKKGNSLYSEITFGEKLSNFLSELLPALPRVLVAILLGFFISTPIELMVFKEDIENNKKDYVNKELKDKKDEISKNYKSHRDKVNESVNELIINNEEAYEKYENDRVRAEKDLVNIDNKISTINKEMEKLKIKMDKEDNGDEFRDAGRGDRFKMYMDEYYEQETLISSKNKEKEAINKSITESWKSYNDKKDKINKGLEKLNAEKLALNREEKNAKAEVKVNADKLSARMQILNMAKEKNKIIKISDYFIKALIIIIEISPILFKLLASRGPVESLTQRISYEKMIENDKSIELLRKNAYKSIYKNSSS